MKKTLIVATGLLFSTLTLSAGNDANTVYEANCKSCHMLKPMMDNQKMMQMSSADRMSMKDKMMKNMKAPPMAKISAKLKHDFKDDKAQIVAFVKDYIVNPSVDKAHCMPMALKQFGMMPPIGKSLSTEDLDTISNWVVDNFNGKWDENAINMMCNTNKGKGMESKPKAGGGAMKCAAGKCGGK